MIELINQLLATTFLAIAIAVVIYMLRLVPRAERSKRRVVKEASARQPPSVGHMPVTSAEQARRPSDKRAEDDTVHRLQPGAYSWILRLNRGKQKSRPEKG